MSPRQSEIAHCIALLPRLFQPTKQPLKYLDENMPLRIRRMQMLKRMRLDKKVVLTHEIIILFLHRRAAPLLY